MEKKKWTRRDILIKAGWGFAAATGAMALKEGYHELTKSEVERAQDWFKTVGEATQKRLLGEIESEVMERTEFGRQTTEFTKRCKKGDGVSGGQRLQKIDVMDGDWETGYGGRHWPYMDRVDVVRPDPPHHMDQLVKGVSPMLNRRHHEVSHWMADQSNPQEAVCDIAHQAGFFMRIDDDVERIKDKISYGNFKGLGVVPQNMYTRFLTNYGKIVRPELIKRVEAENGADKAMGEIESEAMGKLMKFRDGIKNGGLPLIEVHPRMHFLEDDYGQMTPDSHREKVFEAVRKYKGGKNNDEMLQAAYSGTAKLYVLYGRQDEDPVSVHQKVSAAVGASILSYDAKTKKYPLLDMEVSKANEQSGLTEKQLETESEKWVKDNIQRRYQDQQVIKTIAEQMLVKAKAEATKDGLK